MSMMFGLGFGLGLGLGGGKEQFILAAKTHPTQTHDIYRHKEKTR